MKMTSQKWESKDDKKLLKPLMEKRRRDRMNQSLDRLRVLLLEATQDERLKNPKVEKAEILQKTVQFLKTQPLAEMQGRPHPNFCFLRSCERHTCPACQERELATLLGGRGKKGARFVPETKHKEDALWQRYHSGYRECLTQATHFLRASPGICTGKKAYLMEHICHCMEKITVSPGVELHRSPPPPPPAMELQQPYSPDVFAGCSPPIGSAAYVLHPPPTTPTYTTSQGLQARVSGPVQQDGCGRSQQSKLSETRNSTAVQTPQALNVWRPWP